MTHDDLVTHFGNASRAARALGFSRQAVSQWKSRGIPFESQYRIQMKTKGRLRASLPPERKAA
jgi:hypothetical protein